MHIVFITTLYPESEKGIGESGSVTLALHNFVKFWKDSCSVTVLKPSLVLFRELYRLVKNRHLLSDIDDQSRVDGIEVFKCNVLKYSKIHRYFIGFIYQMLKGKEIAPDIIVSHWWYSHFIGQQLAKKMRVPHVVGMHASDIKFMHRTENRRYYKAILENCSGIVCRSDSIRKEISRRKPRLASKCFTAYSGIEESVLEPLGWILNKGKKLGRDKRVRFLSVCNLLIRKNIDVNLRALNRLRRYDWEYRIAGDGPEKDNLTYLAAQLDLMDRVIFLGHCSRERVMEELKNSNVFVMVSWPETFGLAFLEALAKGNIVVASLGSGVDGLIRDGESGFLCEPRNEDALTGKLEDIIHLKTSRVATILERQYNLISPFTA